MIVKHQHYLCKIFFLKNKNIKPTKTQKDFIFSLFQKKIASISLLFNTLLLFFISYKCWGGDKLKCYTIFSNWYTCIFIKDAVLRILWMFLCTFLRLISIKVSLTMTDRSLSLFHTNFWTYIAILIVKGSNVSKFKSCIKKYKNTQPVFFLKPQISQTLNPPIWNLRLQFKRVIRAFNLWFVSSLLISRSLQHRFLFNCKSNG